MTCEKCGGAGTVERDGVLYECECAELKRISAAMPAYIRTAEAQIEHVKLDLLNMYTKSLFIAAAWADMRAVIKLVMLKYRTKFTKITSDRELRDVFVGSTSRASRGEDDRAPIYNSIEDLMRPPDLMIVRLNELGYKNKAAPGILEESLCYRLDREQPTWVVSDLNKPFTTGSFAWSESVWSLITNLPIYRIPLICKELPSNSSAIGSVFEPEEAPRVRSQQVTGSILSPPVPNRAPEKPPEKPKEKKIRSVPDDDLGGISIYGSGIGKKRS